MAKRLVTLALTMLVTATGIDNQVWAGDVTTIYERKASGESLSASTSATQVSALWSAKDIYNSEDVETTGGWTLEGSTTGVTASIDSGLKLNGDNGSNKSQAFTFNKAMNVSSNTSILHLTADWDYSKNRGGNSTTGDTYYSFFRIGDVEIRYTGKNNKVITVCNGTSVERATGANAYYEADAYANISITINQATHAVSYTIKLYKSSTDESPLEISNTEGTTGNNVTYNLSTGFSLANGGSAITETIRNILVTEEAQSVTNYGYTVNYQLNGTTIKTVDVDNGSEDARAEGASIPVLSATTAFYGDDFSGSGGTNFSGQKFFIISDVAPQQSITTDKSSNILNVEVRQQYSTTLNVTRQFDGVQEAYPFITKELVETDYKVANWVYSFPYYVQIDEKWYKASLKDGKFGEEGTFTSEEVNKTIEYTIDNTVINFWDYSHNNYVDNINYSGGSKDDFQKGQTIGSLEAGKYEITVMQDNDYSAKLYKNYTDANNQGTELLEFNNSNRTRTLTLTENASSLQIASSGNSRYDYVLVRKMPSPTVVDLAAANLTYTGSAQNLVTEPTVTGGKIFYSTSEAGEYTTTIPQGTDAGNYSVWYKVTGDETHNDISATEVKNVKINKANLTLDGTLSASDSQGKKLSEITITNSGRVIIEGTEIEVPGTWAFENGDTEPEIGTSTHTAIFTPTQETGKDNYNAMDAQNVSLNITAAGKQDLTFNGTLSATATYGTQVKAITITTEDKVTVNEAEVEGSWSFDTDDTEILKVDNTTAKTATFHPTNDADNYNTLTMDITPTISAATLTITAKDQTIEEGGNITEGIEQVTASGLVGEDALTSITLTASTSEHTITPSDAKINNGDANGNYNIQYVNGILTINETSQTTPPTQLTGNPASFANLGASDVTVSSNTTFYTYSETSKEYAVTKDNNVTGILELYIKGAIFKYNKNGAKFTLEANDLKASSTEAQLTITGLKKDQVVIINAKSVSGSTNSTFTIDGTSISNSVDGSNGGNMQFIAQNDGEMVLKNSGAGYYLYSITLANTLSVSVNDESMGEVSVTSANSLGENYYLSGSNLTLTASAKTGYKFKEWQELNGDEWTTINSATTTEYELTMDGNKNIKAVFEAAAHSHNFSYEEGNGESSNILTATCLNTGCSLEESKATLTLTANDGTYSGSAFAATTDLDAFNSATGLSANCSITYTVDNEYYTTEAPTNVGNYTAKATITIGETPYILTKTFAISQQSLIITAKDQTITVGGNIATGVDQVTAEGLVSSDELTGITLEPSSTAAVTTEGTITPKDAVIKNGAANYDITYKQGKLTITEVPVTTYNITVPAAVNGNSITADVSSAAENATVTLTITTASGYSFKSISAKYADNGTVTLEEGSDGTRTFTMPAADVTITATWTISQTDSQDSNTSETYTVTELGGIEVSQVTSTEGATSITISADKVGDVEVTSIADDAFNSIENKSAIKSVNLSATKITGVEVSRSIGVFSGFPEETMIYMPAGNTAAGQKNVIIGGTCSDFEMKDQSSYNIPKAFTATKATLSRSFTSEKYCTLCLPYDVPATNLGGKIYEFSSIEGTTVKMTEDTDGLNANKPYIFVPNSSVGSIETSGSISVSMSNTPNTNNTGFTFKGVFGHKEFTADELSDGVYGFAADSEHGASVGQFVKASSGAWIEGMRAYLAYNGDLNSTSTASTRGMALPEVLNVVLVHANGSTTSIGKLELMTAEDGSPVYNLSGQRVDKSYKGIVIQNGKKMIKK